MQIIREGAPFHFYPGAFWSALAWRRFGLRLARLSSGNERASHAKEKFQLPVECESEKRPFLSRRILECAGPAALWPTSREAVFRQRTGFTREREVSIASRVRKREEAIFITTHLESAGL